MTTFTWNGPEGTEIDFYGLKWVAGKAQSVTDPVAIEALSRNSMFTKGGEEPKPVVDKEPEPVAEVTVEADPEHTANAFEDAPANVPHPPIDEPQRKKRGPKPGWKKAQTDAG